MNHKRNSETARYFRACELLDIARQGNNEPRIKRLTKLVDHWKNEAREVLHSREQRHDNALEGLKNSLQAAFGKRQQLAA